jgi:15-cis-phytoene synthase
MSLTQAQPWELRLLVAAQEAFRSQARPVINPHPAMLRAAYTCCEAITYRHSRTFYLASSLLPYEQRLAARALYAFCRVTDDIVDATKQKPEERLKALRRWEFQVMSDHPPLDQEVCLAWADTQARFNVPRGYAKQLIDGVRRDLFQTRYRTFDELADYAYGVASTVGLMSMHIVGFRGEDALPYAIRLGVALQLTNILRDVGEDWRNGRCYLPQDELEAFGITEETFNNQRVDDHWRAFMAFQIDRNRKLYAESQDGIGLLERSGRFSIAAAADLYQAILNDIEAHDYDVFTRRAHLGAMAKVSRLPRIWWQSRRPGELA